ncbi:UbiA family prenyltransferase [Roseinatronobacter sp.]|uniref:UbiA family prenyltransferase n=1 Tax=Roseinatronobacter sp. TaxID=1945755 RepID=UPI0025D84BCA|nr:UbiA family prenyltransferase [Roseibaca sp.]
MPDGQADWLLSILNRKKRAGAICVALLRKPNEDKQALAARIGGIDHVAVIPDAQMRNLVPVLNAQLGVPHDARIERISPKPRAAGAQIVAAAFAAVRPHQWIKNLLVFVPLLAAHQINLAALGQALLAFLAFCAVASGVYLLNDLMDLGADRRHLRKRRRPFASGALPLNWAPGLLLGTLALGGALGALVGPQFLAILVLYAGIATAYSLGLKRLVIADITILAGLYTLRIVAGGVATDIRLSIWLLAFSMFLFVALAAIKRLAELVEIDSSPQARVPGRAYRTSDLPFVATLAVASGHVAILILALYINSADFMLLYTTPAALWVACLVLYFWTMRLVLMAYRGQIIDDPIVYAVRDISSWTCAAILAAAVILASIEQPSLPWVSQ